jgi:LPS-assembly lipoprotein
MSWSRHIASALLLAGWLSACGFEPVYAPGGNLEERLSQIHVDSIDSRVGQAARNALLDAIGAPDRPARATHRLSMKIVADRARGGIQADETASRINVIVTTSWQLRLNDIEETVVGSGSITRAVPFNVVDDDYASLIAGRDAERLAGRLSGEALRTRLLLLLQKD